MTDVVIAGIGQTPVGEHWELSLRSLAAKAIQAARKEAPDLKPQAMYIGNLLAPVVSHQSNLGALLVEDVALDGIEAFTIEAAEASGAGAFHMGYLAVASGFVDVALVVGVEKITDLVGPELETAISQVTDYDFEATQGATPTALAGLLMQRYLHEYQPHRPALGAFPLLAHANAVNNPFAMFRRAVRQETYQQAGMVCDPLNLYDVAPYADGAAAVILARSDLLPGDFPFPRVRVTGSAVAIDTLALHDRHDPLAFRAAAISVERASRQAGILPRDVDLFELSDAYSIYTVLSLEAAGFARRGEGWKLGQDGMLSLKGKLPITTLGGLKGRGNPLGATGVYQIVEATQQLRGQAGANQVPAARRALVQSLGGPASTAITHVLSI